jgi:hypothetical protein
MGKKKNKTVSSVFYPRGGVGEHGLGLGTRRRWTWSSSDEASLRAYTPHPHPPSSFSSIRPSQRKRATVR